MEMVNISISKEIIERLKIIEGVNVEAKLVYLLNSGFVSQLRECESNILDYETKYGLSFDDFSDLWNKNQIKEKHSHEVERDFMEWEGFQLERSKWLGMIRDLKNIESEYG